MARAIQFIIILSLILILFRMGGLGGGSPMLTLLMNINDIESLPLGVAVLGALSLAASGAGIALGLMYPYKFDQWMTVGIAVLMINYVMEMIGIYNVISTQVNYWMATVIVAPMIIFGVLIIIEWWRGKDW